MVVETLGPGKSYHDIPAPAANHPDQSDPAYWTRKIINKALKNKSVLKDQIRGRNPILVLSVYCLKINSMEIMLATLMATLMKSAWKLGM